MAAEVRSALSVYVGQVLWMTLPVVGAITPKVLSFHYSVMLAEWLRDK